MELPGNDLKGIVSKFKPKYVAPVEQPEVAPQQPSQNDEIEQRLRGLGYTQDDINTYFSPDPNTPIYEQIYRKTIKEPKPLSEKGARAARTVAGIGDSLGLLSQVFGASRGAHVGPIQNSSVAYQANDERNMRNLYSKELDQYNAGLAGAQGADAQIQLAEKRALRNKMLEGLSAYEKRKQEAYNKAVEFEQWKANMGYKQARDAKEDAKWKADFAQRERHNNSTENKAKEDKSYVEVNIKGKPYKIKKTYVQDIVSRARNLPENQAKGAGDYRIEPLEGMSDEEIFTKYKDQYLDVTPDGYITVGHFPKELRDRQKSKSNTNSDPLGLGL